MNDPAMGAGIWLDTVLRRLRHAAGDRAARLRGAAAMTGRDHYSPIGYGTPMTDIVERLRTRAHSHQKGCEICEAADEIERLRAYIETLEIELGCGPSRALEPKP